MPRLRPLLMLGWLLLAEAAGAQGRVRGVVFDSLLTRRTVAGAVVSVDGTALSTRTNARGRFEIDDVPAGRRRLSVRYPGLDSLRLPALVAEVTVRDRRTARTVAISTPAPGTYQRAVCGARLEAGHGILWGVVADADGFERAGVFTGAVWSEAVVSTAGMAGQLMGTVDTSAADGSFSLCGVPREASFLVKAGDDSLSTGELLFELEGRSVVRRDLVIGPGDRTATVRLAVRSERDRPVVGAIVDVPGDSVIGGRTDSAGNIVLRGVPRRTAQLVVRAIGFTPQYVTIYPPAEGLELPDVVLPPIPQELEAYRIVANRATTLAELEFAQRRTIGTGVFMDEEMLLRFPVLSATVLQFQSTRIRSSGGAFPRTLLRQVSGFCRPRFFLDGIDWGVPRDGIEEAELMRRAKRLEVHEAAFMPARYTDFNGCGVVLIWTQ